MCSKSAIFLENNASNKERSGLQYTWNEHQLQFIYFKHTTNNIKNHVHSQTLEEWSRFFPNLRSGPILAVLIHCPPECNFQSETKIEPDLRLILSRTSLSYKRPGPPLRAKEKVKKHLIRDKLNSCQKQKPQETIHHWNRSDWISAVSSSGKLPM